MKLMDMRAADELWTPVPVAEPIRGPVGKLRVTFSLPPARCVASIRGTAPVVGKPVENQVRARTTPAR